jgi:hypothetical protein
MWDGETSPIEKQEAANGEEVEHGRVADEATSGGGEAASGRPPAALFTFTGTLGRYGSMQLLAHEIEERRRLWASFRAESEWTARSSLRFLPYTCIVVYFRLIVAQCTQLFARLRQFIG